MLQHKTQDALTLMIIFSLYLQHATFFNPSCAYDIDKINIRYIFFMIFL